MAYLQGILLIGHFPVANTPHEIPSELVLLEYSQGLVNWHGRLVEV